jgi:hypothetical protein
MFVVYNVCRNVTVTKSQTQREKKSNKKQTRVKRIGSKKGVNYSSAVEGGKGWYGGRGEGA